MTIIKQIHVVLAILSGCGFALRGYWMLFAPERLRALPVRIAPHVVDTALLATGIAMAVAWRISPIDHPWLAAKLGALVVYIVLGTIALKRGRTRNLRVGALAGALAVFAYIVAVAIRHDPLPIG